MKVWLSLRAAWSDALCPGCTAMGTKQTAFIQIKHSSKSRKVTKYSSSLFFQHHFKYKRAVKLRKKTTLSPKKWAFIERPVWFPSSLELRSSTRKAPTLRRGIVPALPYHRGCHVWCRGGASLGRLLRALWPCYTGMKLNWNTGTFSENLLRVSLQCILHTFSHREPLLKRSRGLSRPGLWPHQYIHNHLLPDLKLQQNPEQFVLCLSCSSASPAVFPLQHLPPKDIYGKKCPGNATFIWVSLGNAEHLAPSTILIRLPFVNLSDATISDCSSGKMSVDSSCPMPFKKTQKDAFISCICSDFIAKALGQTF